MENIRHLQPPVAVQSSTVERLKNTAPPGRTRGCGITCHVEPVFDVFDKIYIYHIYYIM